MKTRVQLETAQYLLNQINFPEVKMEIKEDPIYLLEKMYSIRQLEDLLEEALDCFDDKPQPEDFKPLEDFLAVRWERIRATDLAYTHAEKDPLTAVCLSVAQGLSSIFNKSAYELLMPTIDLNAPELYEMKPLKQRLNDNELQIHQFVLSDDDTRIIEVLPCMESSEEEGELKHTTLFGEPPQAKKLSLEEQKRVINHSKQTQDYYLNLQQVIRIKKFGKSNGAYIQRLIDKLRQGGAHGGRGGLELKAAADANLGIVEFSQFLENLSTQEKNELFQVSAPGVRDNLRLLWERLSRPDKNSMGIRYCVELIANDLEKILQHNQQLFSLTSELKDKERCRGIAKNKLDKEIKGFNYIIQPAYLAPGKNRLIKELGKSIRSASIARYFFSNLRELLSKLPVNYWPDLKELIITPQALGNLIFSLSKKEVESVIAALSMEHIKTFIRSVSDLRELIGYCYDVWKIQAIVSQCGKDIIFDAVSRRDLNTFKKMLDEVGISPNEMKDGDSLAHKVISIQHSDMLKELALQDANFNITSSLSSKSPLSIAIELENWTLVAIMLKADLEEVAFKKWNIGHIAAKQNRSDLIPIISHQMLKNSIDRYGNTPAHIAVDLGNIAMIRALGEHKASFSMLNSTQQTTAHIAVRNGNVEVIKELVKLKVDFNKQNQYGLSPIIDAIHHHQLLVLAAILQIDLDLVTTQKWTAAHILAYAGRADLIMTLHHSKEPLDKPNILGQTPAHIAAARGHAEFLETLAKYKVSLDYQDNQQKTPTHVASEFGHVSSLEVLGKKRIDLNNEDSKGETPVYIAIKNGFSECVKVLAKYGANLNPKNNIPVMVAVIINSDNPNMISTLIECKVDLNNASTPGYSLAHHAVENHRLKTIELLVQHKVDFNKPNRLGKTAFEMALEKNEKEIIALILQEKSEPLQPSVITKSIPFMVINSGKVEYIPLLAKYNINLNESEAGTTSAHLAVRKDSPTLVTALVEAKADFSKLDEKGNTPIHYATKKMLLILLKNNVDIQQANSLGKTIAHTAIENKDLDLIKELIELKVDFYKKSKLIESPLSLAIKTNSIEIIASILKLDPELCKMKKWSIGHCLAISGRTLGLLKSQIDLDQPDVDGNTPAHLAIMHNNFKFIAMLAAKKVDMYKQNNASISPMRMIIEKKDTTLIARLLQFTLFQKDWTAAHYAAASGDVQFIRLLHQSREELDRTDNEGCTPVHIAVLYNHPEIIEALSECKQDCNIKNKSGLTPIQIAVRQGLVSCIKMLSLCFVNLNQQDEYGDSLIHMAILFDKMDSLSKLCNYYVDLELKNNDGLTALQYAYEVNNLEAFILLINNRANVNVLDKEGRTLLECAIKQNKRKFLEVLSQADPDVQLKTADGEKTLLDLMAEKKLWNYLSIILKVNLIIGQTLPHIAARTNNIKLMRELAKDGRILNCQDKYCTTPLYLAVINENKDILKILAESEYDLNESEVTGQSSIHLAVTAKKLNIIKSLVEFKADPNCLDDKGFSPLQVAVKNKNIPAVITLVECKASLSQGCENSENDTALHLAVKQGSDEVVSELINLKADINVKNDEGKSAVALMIEQKRWDHIVNILLNIPDKKIINPIELNLITLNRDLLTTEYISYVNKLDDKKKHESLHTVMQNKCALGHILSTPGNSFTHFFKKGARHGLTDKIYRIAETFNYDFACQEFKLGHSGLVPKL